MSAVLPAEEGPWRRFLSQFVESKLAMFGLVLLTLLILAAIFAPVIAPQNPYDLSKLDIMDGRMEPGTIGEETKLTYRLGTDEQGRDMLSAMLYGLRISIGVGVVATAVAMCIGLFVGLIAGYLGGRLESFLMRVVDIQLSFPTILLALILIAALGAGITNVVVALITVQWAYYARTARSAALVERKKEYIEAARALGLSTPRIVLRHLLPNCLPSVIVIAALQVASAIQLEATLSFLGLGVPITEPSLGLLISNGFQYMLSGRYWISVYPGVLLLITIVAINLVADRLRDLLNPRLQTQ
ncbi:ABC transporter permease [soil metagenome]